jgi:hypothetical protein
LSDSSRRESYPAIVKVAVCVRCAAPQEAFSYTPGQAMPYWPPVIVRLPAPPAPNTQQEYTRYFCPGCADAVPDVEERKRFVRNKIMADPSS